MTDTQIIALISQMMADVIEFTDYDNSAKDALLCCIQSVIDDRWCEPACDGCGCKSSDA